MQGFLNTLTVLPGSAQALHGIPVAGNGNLLLQLANFRDIRRIVLGGIRHNALFKGFALIAKIGGRAVNVQRMFAGRIHVGNVVL